MAKRTNRGFARQIALAAILLTATSASVTAGPILDQHYDSAGNLLSVLAEEYAYTAQTVTADEAGALVAVDLSVGQSPQFALQWSWVLDVVNVSNGNPTGEILASQNIDLPPVFSFGIPRPFFRFEFSVPAVFGVGDVFALALHPRDKDGKDVIGSPGQSAGLWMGGTGDPYSGGSVYFGTDAGSLKPGDPDFDLNFRTFVAASTVPEPSSLGLFGIGLLAGLKAFRRRKTIKASKRAV